MMLENSYTIGGQRPLWFINDFKFTCAIIVVLCHYALAFFPYMLDGREENIHFFNFENAVRNTQLYTLVNGTFFVYVFWVISGFLIYYVWSKDKTDERLAKSLLGKYLKPLAGIFLANLCAMILQMAGAFRNVEAAAISHSEYGIAPYYQQAATVGKLLYETFIGIYISENSLSFFVNPMWSMRLEFIGTAVTVFMLWLSTKLVHKWFAYVVECALCISIDIRLSCFMFGVLIAKYYLSKIQIHIGIGVVLCVIAVLFCSGNLRIIQKMSAIIWQYDAINFDLGYLYQSVMAAVMFMGIVAIFKRTCLKIKEVGADSTGKVLDTGNLSMYVYFFHWPILCSLACCVFIKSVERTGNYILSVGLAYATGIVTTLVFSIIIKKLLDLKWNNLCEKFIAHLIKNKSISTNG